MIAQNDFLRFLQSGTDDRLKILRRIFGTGALKAFQENLKSRAKELSGELDSYRRDFELHEVDPYKRDEQFAEWETQIKNDKAVLTKTDKNLAGYEKQKTDLTAQTAVAEELAKKFEGLNTTLFALAEHSAKADEMKLLTGRRTRGEIALHRVRPLADKAGETGRQYAEAQADFEKAKTGLETAFTELEKAKKILAELPPFDEKQAAYDTLKQEWEQSSANLVRLNGLQENFNTIVSRQNDLAAAQTEFEKLDGVYGAVNATYEGLYAAFLREQAGLLANSLTSGKPCPVCGSKEHPAPAHISDESLSEAAVNKAKDTAEKARKDCEAKAGQCNGLKTEISTLTGLFLKGFAGFVPDTVWDTAGEQLAKTLTAAAAKTEKLTLQKEAGERTLADLKKNHETAAKRNIDTETAYKAAQTLAAERERRGQEQLKLQEKTQAAYMAALQAHGFAAEAEYIAALVTEDELAKMIKRLADYEKEGERLDADIKRLTAETSDKEKPDLGKLAAEVEAVNTLIAELRGKRDEVKSRLEQTERVLQELRRSAEYFAKLEKQYAAIKQLSDTANGKTDFETYAQTAYFERVLRAANLRLKLMSQNRYTLLRKTDSDDARRKSGLELEVSDTYTGKSRSANSLSGGESFMASLSLALGLSDVVQQNAGGIRLDAMFIDEGFGSLDAEVLELAVRTLSEMADDGRIIGIISHVAELRERIDKQIRVVKTPVGSRLSIAV
jgi:exonuclease SbcC